ncbi:MAG: NAD-dependent DNA ligase [Hatfieldvirus porci]|uniref:DNA ligase (NAD(+)) n=1 Tax=phage Lak_Megaphage_RVC_JS4_GC31 TaxID=3109228 RepID=A0ABZ0Z410_9CAUD|nr:MAG: NAD-dependent DNA ligase [phage Lak_Megaphage_RVC_AP3_GC31]WQJ53207.1 MAG: NAD-dependent DNA ligase [phage Lak_Megaphage_RVC_JS4_GC31]
MNNSSEIKLLIDNITELMNSNQSDNSEYDEQSEILNTALISLSVNDIKSDLSKKYIEKLLDIAKDYYYNTGNELIDDAMYDELESFIDLENKNYVGSKSSAKHANYTVKHSFIMGSLAKIQIKEDKKTGIVDWDTYANEFKKYFDKSTGCKYFETTPKLDGCSFSAEFDSDGDLISCATRGDGEYGSDISHWFNAQLKTKYWSKIKDCCVNLLDKNDTLVIRGEVLVPSSAFKSNYANDFKNPRSYVAGKLGTKPSDLTESNLSGSNLHYVCYDYRIVDGETGTFTELSWMNPHDSTYKLLKPYLNGIGELPESKYCQVHPYNGNFTGEELQKIYDEYNSFRANESEYPLDGIVFKPEASARQYNDDRARPVDCVAMKFIPMINATEIVDIEWNVKKTGEYFPKAIINPVYMDGKEIRKASLHNYGYIMKHKCGIGSSVRISLAGDIIPFVYEIVHAAGTENINLPEDSEVNGVHLMKIFNDESELQKNQFIASANALNINTIGPAAASNLWDSLHNDVDNLCNIVLLMTDDNCELIYEKLGKSRSVDNIVKNLKEFRSHLTLEELILSFCFKNCGHRASALCAKIITGQDYSTASMGAESYKWAENPNSKEYMQVVNTAELLGISLEPTEDDSADGDKIPVIMTGSPKEFGFNTKKDFLAAHPEYVETTSWSDCKILFTDDLNSTSGKMKKAAKAGIPVKLYESTLENKLVKSVENAVNEAINELF